jgi:magnesium-transporting ATPase (P-type)
MCTVLLPPGDNPIRINKYIISYQFWEGKSNGNSQLHVLQDTKVFLTLTEVFPCFFLSCKANARVKLAKTGHGPHSSKLVVICVVLLLFVLFYVLFVCKCVLYYCHRVTTQLHSKNISYHINSGKVRAMEILNFMCCRIRNCNCATLTCFTLPLRLATRHNG